MNRNACFRLAASGLALGLGIAAPTANLLADDGSAPHVDTARAARSADRAADALQSGRRERAVAFAEDAVSLNPGDASYRSLLGQAYLSNGRFTSAEASFDAARQLGATDARTIIGHALSLIATGHQQDALTLIDANAQTLPASDFGLALALAGEPARAVMVLTDVVRSGESTPRDRQNLALSYAMAGRWLEARLIAMQDVAAGRVAERMEQWTQMLQSPDPRLRIAGIMGTSVTDDPGMPVRFALNAHPSGTALAASDDPAPLALYAPSAPTESESPVVASVALPAPTPMAEVPASAAPAPAPAAPVAVASAAALPAAAHNGIVYVSNPVIQQLRSAVAMIAPLADHPARPAARPVARSGAMAAPAPAAPVVAGPVRASGWAVQLGSYESVGVARDGWARLSRRFAAQIAGRPAVSTQASVNGQAVHRLSLTGYASRADADAQCRAITAAGGRCFVRSFGRDETLRWASRTITATRVAAR